MQKKVVFSSAGRRVELIRCFMNDARELGIPLRTVAIDMNPRMSAACRIVDKAYTAPPCVDSAFIPFLKKICLEENAELVIPTIDTELLTLSRAKKDFQAAGIRIAVSEESVVAMARNKLQTAQFLTSVGIPTPITLSLEEARRDKRLFSGPVIVKPISGSSSVGMQRMESVNALDGLSLPPDKYMVQEEWLGEEYTVNVFFDRTGRMRAAVPHHRVETRAGEVSKGTTRRIPLLQEFADRLGSHLQGACGALCFQAMVRPDGSAAVFEINARFGGGFPLTHRAGAPFSRWLLQEISGLPCEADNRWQENLTMLRYDAALFFNGGAS